MRARFSDPQGPMTWRAAPYVGPVAAFAFACYGLEGDVAWILGTLALAAFNVLGVLPLRQREPRDVELEPRPGQLVIRKAGTRNQRIRATDVVGGTTARAGEAVVLTLQHARRDQPVTIEVKTEGEAEAIRKALGIGHDGFGVVGWRSVPTDALKSGVVGRVLAAAIALLCVALYLFGAPDAAAITGALLGIFGVIGMLLGIAALLSRPNDPTIVMTSEGLRLRTLRGWFALPYDRVLQVDDRQRGIVFRVPPPYGTVGVETYGPVYGGLTAHDRQIVIAQVNAAAARARGLGPQKNDVSARVEMLRRNGATPRDWLNRLDMAGRLLSTAPGYRGNTLDTEDLWAILEDPDADAELRAAAARVLRHAPQRDARVRIDAALAAVRDEPTNRRMRIAMSDDVESASQELASLEAQEMHRRAYARYASHER